MAVGNDRNWAVVGTVRGYVSLWDIRFQKMVKVWRHGSGAPVNRLGTSFAALKGDTAGGAANGEGGGSKPYVVMGCGQNEVSVFDIVDGGCRHCFRVLDPASSYLDQNALPPRCTSLPVLTELPIKSEFRRRMHGIDVDAVRGMITGNGGRYPPEPSIRSMTGRIGTNGRNYLITGGTDGFIRYWDFAEVNKCFTVSGGFGPTNDRPRPVYESIVDDGGMGGSGEGSIYLCRPRPNPKRKERLSDDNVPKRMQYGAVRPGNRHSDAILDIKKIETPMKGLLSCSRDGVIKFWR